MMQSSQADHWNSNACIRGCGKRASDAFERFIDTIIERPRSCFFGCGSVLFVLVAVAGATQSLNLTQQETAWQVVGAPATEAYLAHRQAEQDAGFIEGGEEENEEEEPAQLLLIYRASGSTVFTPESLRDICNFEALAVKSSVCPPSSNSDSCAIHTPIMVFYGGWQQALAQKCRLLQESEINNGLGLIQRDLEVHGTSSRFAAMLTPDFVSTNRSLHSQSLYLLKGKKEPRDDVVFEQMFGQFEPKLSYGFLRSAFQADSDRMVQMRSVRVRIFYAIDEFNAMIATDFSMAVASVVFVFFALWAHLGSLFMASMCMFQIVASLPIAALVYRKIFMVHYFDFIHILVVYLVLGIGADDVFVLLDSWRHLKLQHGVTAGKSDTLRKAFRGAVVRTAQSTFNTSLTTAVAFMSMSLSEAMPLKACGYYSAICMIINYLLAITFTPTILMVHHLYFSGRPCLCPCFRQRTQKDGTAPAESLSGQGIFSACVEKALTNCYVPIMKKRVAGLKIFPIFFVLAMTAVGIQGAVFASKLTPPSKPEVWFPHSHMMNDLNPFLASTFYAADSDNYAMVRFVWGIKGMDYEDFDMYRPDDYPGAVVFDDEFDISSSASQQAVLDFCKALRTVTCDLEGCRAPAQGTKTLAFQKGAKKAVSCFLQDFQRWLNTTEGSPAMPTGAAFNEKLIQFGQVFQNASADDELIDPSANRPIGVIDGRIRYVAVVARTSVLQSEPYGTGLSVRKLLEDFTSEWQTKMPRGMTSFFFTSGQMASYDLGETLLNGLLASCASAGPIVFVVLLLSSANLILALYAVVSVAAIVFCVLGFCKSPMDYDLGIGEAIAGVIVIGYSVDYVLHLAHIYRSAGNMGLKTRDDRSSFAIQNMGSTVFAGAITTAGSGAFMFACFLTFFLKMALLICTTIIYSFLFSLLFFMGLCFLAGPEGTCGDICCFRASPPKADEVVDKVDNEQPPPQTEA